MKSKSTSPGSALEPTILAPVFFMENLSFGKEQLAKGVYASALPPTRKLAQVAVADIGAVAVRVLEDAERFAGRRFDLAGDELTGKEVVAVLSRVTGRPFSYSQIPLDVLRQRSEDYAKMTEWFDRVGYTVDRAALRREFPDVAFHDFESWRRRRIGMRSCRGRHENRCQWCQWPSGQSHRFGAAAARRRARGRGHHAHARNRFSAGQGTIRGITTRPESLGEAYAGLDRLLIIPTVDPEKRRAQNVAAFDAAVKAGIKHIVFMSSAGARQEKESALGTSYWWASSISSPRRRRGPSCA